jgi:hypothetical protein
MAQPVFACEICGNEAKPVPAPAMHQGRDCPRCGTFIYSSNTAVGAGWLKVESPDHMIRLSGWVRDQNAMDNQYPNITMDVSKRVKTMPLPRLPRTR